MAQYRVRRPSSINVEALGRVVDLAPEDVIDTDDPEGAAIVAEWEPRGLLRQDNAVEQATAAPGEMRTTRREGEAA